MEVRTITLNVRAVTVLVRPGHPDHINIELVDMLSAFYAGREPFFEMRTTHGKGEAWVKDNLHLDPEVIKP